MSTVTEALPAERRRGVVAGFRRLYYGQTRFDFVRRKRTWFLISAAVILAGIGSLATRGLNFDIEFVGGTSWQVPSNGATVAQTRAALAPYGLSAAQVTMLGTGTSRTLQVEAKLGAHKRIASNAVATKISKVLARVTHHSSINKVSVQQVGPTWGSQITDKAALALVVFFIMIAIYISIFFEWKMALAAIIAVLHDILVTVGIYSLSGFLVTPDTVVAFLTILGYSLYDTIVVFDRVRDNTRGLAASGKLSFTDVVNLSMNQTLARSVNTSLVAILPILAVLVLGANFLGATTLQYFGLALLIGLASGAYSSIFIASPLVAMLKEREPRYRQIRARLEGRGAGALLLTPAAVAAGALSDQSSAGGSRRRRSGRAAPLEGPAGPLRPGRSFARDEGPDGAARDEGVPPTLSNGYQAPPSPSPARSGSAPAPRPKASGPRPGAPRPRKKRRR